MIIMSSDDLVISAPGKVLLAGGYLVLDPAYPGVVVSTSSRFYCRISKQQFSSTTDKGKGREAQITVRSPQFTGALWKYNLRTSSDCVDLIQSAATFQQSHAGKNPFVGLALLYTYRLALETLGAEEFQRTTEQPIQVTIVGDNDFYSQRQHSAEGSGSSSQAGLAEAPTFEYLSSLPPFNPLNVPIRDVHKTGLGSSAAMTTSLVGALLVHLGVVSAADGGASSTTLSSRDLALVHNVAQLAHCAAQGKVGSGFDVSAAVWGSQLYRRFKPQVLQPLLDRGAKVLVEGEADEDTRSSTSGAERLRDVLDPERNPEWAPLTGKPTAVEGLAQLGLSASETQSSSSIPKPAPLYLPPRISMVLADVDTGSNTPSLVSKVHAWKKEKPEWAAQLYSVLDASNQNLADGLLALALAYMKHPQEYDCALDAAGAVKTSEWDARQQAEPSDTLELLISVRNALRSIRAGMRELGQRAGAPVEPDEMGKLIRESIDSAPGVLGGGVPGGER